jgi:hypothetical protein
MDHGFTRQTEDWEKSDGCVYLVRELAQVKQIEDSKAREIAHGVVYSQIEQLCDIALIDHFKHAHTLKENLFKTLDQVIQPSGLGKKKFRAYVDMYVEPTFRNCTNANQNCAAAAQDFLIALQQTYGENIFRAILEGVDPRYPQQFEQYKFIAAQGAQGDF